MTTYREKPEFLSLLKESNRNIDEFVDIMLDLQKRNSVEEADRGEQISKGDLLFHIDDSSYQVLLANAEKDLANAQLSFLQEQRKHQRAQKEWKTSGIKEAPSPLALREPQFKAAKAQLNAAQQAVEDATQQLSNTNIYAPFDAIVSQSSVTTGSVVASGTTLGQIKSIETAEVHLQLTEGDWQQLPTDLSALSVTIQSASDSGQQWAAQASHLSLLVEQSTRMRNLILKIDTPLQQPEPLLLGSFVKIIIPGKSYSDSFVVSSSSITADGNIWYVKEGLLHRHKTQSLFQDIDAIGFKQGNLNQHITLVVKPLSSYVEGMQVLALSGSPRTDDTDKLALNRSLPTPASGDKSLKEVNDGQ
mgnify:CR=1 FL=1